jgi:predicted RNA-binding protein with TRAM domain
MGLAACDDDPFSFNWDPRPDTVLLYSLARPELNLVSAFAFFQRREVRIEAAGSTGEWDAAVDTRDGGIVLLPPGALGVVGAARITTLEGMTLEDVRRAPEDTLVYTADQAVPVEMGNVYVIKTNRSAGSFGSSCVYYAKMAPVDIDPSGGTLTFQYVTNPVCNSQDLVPPN